MGPLSSSMRPSKQKFYSVAGLLAARVCSSHFDDVLIIDPDNDVLVARAQASLPPQPGEVVDLDIGHHTRARVMQTQIIHVNQGMMSQGAIVASFCC